MYNIHTAAKIKKELKKQRINHIKQQKYIENYTNQVQPQLLHNYNKRINIFLRKMQQHPLIIDQIDMKQTSPHKLFRDFTEQKDKCLGPEVFRFKDKYDWNSIYNQLERTERKNNENYMKEKFGDPSLAYRSIASDSFYETAYKHQFRLRQKQKQINPPMKYVCAVPKIMIRKLNAKNHLHRMKTQGHQTNSKQKLNSNNIDPRKNRSLMSKKIADDDNKSVHSFKTMRTYSDESHLRNDEQTETNQQNEEDIKQKHDKQKQVISDKIHFKTLIESFNLSGDSKMRENLKQVLVKCRVFRVKDKNGIQQGQIDKLSMAIDNASVVNNNPVKSKKNIHIK